MMQNKLDDMRCISLVRVSAANNDTATPQEMMDRRRTILRDLRRSHDTLMAGNNEKKKLLLQSCTSVLQSKASDTSNEVISDEIEQTDMRRQLAAKEIEVNNYIRCVRFLEEELREEKRRRMKERLLREREIAKLAHEEGERRQTGVRGRPPPSRFLERRGGLCA